MLTILFPVFKVLPFYLEKYSNTYLLCFQVCFWAWKILLEKKKVENVVITTWPPPKGAEKGTANSINCLWCVLKLVSELSKISVFARKKKKIIHQFKKKKHNCDCYFDLLMFVLQKSYRLNINHMIWQIDTTSKIKIWLSLKNIKMQF